MEAMTNLTNGGTNTGTSVGSSGGSVVNNNVAANTGSGSNGSVAGSNVDSGSQNGSTGSGRSTPSSDSSPGKLFVGGLSWQTTPEKLRDYFGQFGNVTDVLVMKDPVTQVNTIKKLGPIENHYVTSADQDLCLLLRSRQKNR